MSMPNSTSVRIRNHAHEKAKRLADEFRTNLADIVEVGVEEFDRMTPEQKHAVLRRQPERAPRGRRAKQPA